MFILHPLLNKKCMPNIGKKLTRFRHALGTCIVWNHIQLVNKLTPVFLRHVTIVSVDFITYFYSVSQKK